MIDFALQIERIADSLAAFLESTDSSVLSSPLRAVDGSGSRSPLELAGECVATNRYFAALLTGSKIATESRGQFDSTPATAQEARSELVASAGRLADVVRGMTTDDYERTYPHWRGEVAGQLLVMGAYRNMAYHAGQVNLIQILQGDHEFHVPSTWY